MRMLLLLQLHVGMITSHVERPHECDLAAGYMMQPRHGHYTPPILRMHTRVTCMGQRMLCTRSNQHPYMRVLRMHLTTRRKQDNLKNDNKLSHAMHVVHNE